MSKELFSLFHLLFNSFVLFTAFALLVEVIFYLFRISNTRVKTFFRLLPLAKIVLDVVLYKLPISFFYNLNPFGCKKYFNRCLHDMCNFSFFTGQGSGMLILSAFLAITLFLVGRKFYQLYQAHRFLRSLIRASEVCSRPVENPQIQRMLERTKAKIVVSKDTQIPFATANSFIVLPEEYLNTLTAQEFAAVIAHELEHVRYRDPLVKILCALLASFFWWLPIRFWLRQLEKDQESASDTGVHSYGIRSLDLASGIVKAAGQLRKKPNTSPLVCSILSSQTPYVKRLEQLLNHKSGAKTPLFCLFIPSALLSLYFFSLWVC